MKKVLRTLVLFAILTLTLTGCTTSKSFTWTITTGDKIKVELDTTGGYDLSSEIPFVISKDNKSLTQGIFITKEEYNLYVDGLSADEKVSVIDSGTKEGIKYTFYSFNNLEFNYVIDIENANTGIILGNSNSQTEAEEIFNRLTISKE